MDRLSSAGLLAARLLIAPVFLFSGVRKVFAFGATQEAMAAHGMRMTGLFLVMAILLELGGGLSVLLGYRTRLGAALLILFLVPATLVFHRAVSDPAQAIQLAKNLAIMGGLLALATAGGGAFSVRRGGGAIR